LKAEEIASANCDEKMISSAYNKCIAAAATSFPHIAALAYERAATVLHERNWECSREVKFYIEKAIEAYKIWGARGKVQDLRNKYATYL